MYTLNKLINEFENADIPVIDPRSTCAEIKQVLLDIGSSKPQSVRRFYNTAVLFYIDWCVQRILGRFKFTGLPDSWSSDYFAESLLLYGHVCVTQTPEYGLSFFRNSFREFDLYYQPVYAVVANPVVGNFERMIGRDCEIIKIKPDFTGFVPLIEKYAYLLAQCDSSVDVNLWNSKVTMVYRAGDSKEAKEMKLINQQISQGEPAVFTGALESNSDVFYLPAKQNYIAADVMDTKHVIVNEFLSELGINNSPVDKKERVTKDEVNSNNEELGTVADGYIRRIKECMERTNNMFGTNLDVELGQEQAYVQSLQSDAVRRESSGTGLPSAGA